MSHDYDFIDEVCTDITHYDNGGELGKPCKFVYYPMTFKEFQQLKPEIAAGLPGLEDQAPKEFRHADSASESGSMSRVNSLAGSMDKLSVASGGSEESASKSESSEGAGKVEMSSTIARVEEMIAAGLILPMRFPDPGKPDGIRTFRKPVMTLKDVSFKYPETDKYVLEKVTATLTLGSRAVIVGGNGSGKTTLLKLLIGDLEPEEGVGEVWKHHNLRLAYVAQQSLHHLEDYVQVTPIHYIQERFRQGLDARWAAQDAGDHRRGEGAEEGAGRGRRHRRPREDGPGPVVRAPAAGPDEGRHEAGAALRAREDVQAVRQEDDQEL